MVDQNEKKASCTFCGKGSGEVKRLIAGPGVYICDECTKECVSVLEGIKSKEEDDLCNRPVDISDLPTPAEIKAYLDDYVIGQENAKRVLSVAVYNHFKRIRNKDRIKRIEQQRGAFDGRLRKSLPPQVVEIQKSNILLLGPTGCGKTYLAQALAKLMDVPFAMTDATCLTEAGYVGEDVENVISTLLLNANGDVQRCCRGVVYIDEIDKIAAKGASSSSGRDVGGEGVQQALLKLIEGTIANITSKLSSNGAMPERVQVDTSDILFICGGSFHGLEQSIRRRVGVKGLGFGAKFQDKDGMSEAELLKLAETQDLVKFGIIPELIGRLPIVVALDDLSEDDLVKVLTEPKNAIVRQYQKLFACENVKLTFTKGALKAVARESLRRKSGARGLKAILEDAMLDIMFSELYRPGLTECRITQDVILHHAQPVLIFGDQKSQKSA